MNHMEYVDLCKRCIERKEWDPYLQYSSHAVVVFGKAMGWPFCSCSICAGSSVDSPAMYSFISHAINNAFPENEVFQNDCDCVICKQLRVSVSGGMKFLRVKSPDAAKRPKRYIQHTPDYGEQRIVPRVDRTSKQMRRSDDPCSSAVSDDYDDFDLSYDVCRCRAFERHLPFATWIHHRITTWMTALPTGICRCERCADDDIARTGYAVFFAHNLTFLMTTLDIYSCACVACKDLREHDEQLKNNIRVDEEDDFVPQRFDEFGNVVEASPRTQINDACFNEAFNSVLGPPSADVKALLSKKSRAGNMIGSEELSAKRHKAGGSERPSSTQSFALASRSPGRLRKVSDASIATSRSGDVDDFSSHGVQIVIPDEKNRNFSGGSELSAFSTCSSAAPSPASGPLAPREIELFVQEHGYRPRRGSFADMKKARAIRERSLTPSRARSPSENSTYSHSHRDGDDSGVESEDTSATVGTQSETGGSSESAQLLPAAEEDDGKDVGADDAELAEKSSRPDDLMETADNRNGLNCEACGKSFGKKRQLTMHKKICRKSELESTLEVNNSSFASSVVRMANSAPTAVEEGVGSESENGQACLLPQVIPNVAPAVEHEVANEPAEPSEIVRGTKPTRKSIRKNRSVEPSSRDDASSILQEEVKATELGDRPVVNIDAVVLPETIPPAGESISVVAEAVDAAEAGPNPVVKQTRKSARHKLHAASSILSVDQSVNGRFENTPTAVVNDQPIASVIEPVLVLQPQLAPVEKSENRSSVVELDAGQVQGKVEREAQPGSLYVCGNCGKGFDVQQGLAGHAGHCRKKKGNINDEANLNSAPAPNPLDSDGPGALSPLHQAVVTDCSSSSHADATQENHVEESSKEIQEKFGCESCGKHFSTTRGLSIHHNSCKKKPTDEASGLGLHSLTGAGAAAVYEPVQLQPVAAQSHTVSQVDQIAACAKCGEPFLAYSTRQGSSMFRHVCQFGIVGSSTGLAVSEKVAKELLEKVKQPSSTGCGAMFADVVTTQLVNDSTTDSTKKGQPNADVVQPVLLQPQLALVETANPPLEDRLPIIESDVGQVKGKVESEAKPGSGHVCGNCGKGFAVQKGLAGHLAHCKKKKENVSEANLDAVAVESSSDVYALSAQRQTGAMDFISASGSDATTRGNLLQDDRVEESAKEIIDSTVVEKKFGCEGCGKHFSSLRGLSIHHNSCKKNPEEGAASLETVHSLTEAGEAGVLEREPVQIQSIAAVDKVDEIPACDKCGEPLLAYSTRQGSSTFRHVCQYDVVGSSTTNLAVREQSVKEPAKVDQPVSDAMLSADATTTQAVNDSIADTTKEDDTAAQRNDNASPIEEDPLERLLNAVFDTEECSVCGTEISRRGLAAHRRACWKRAIRSTASDVGVQSGTRAGLALEEGSSEGKQADAAFVPDDPGGKSVAKQRRVRSLSEGEDVEENSANVRRDSSSGFDCPVCNRHFGRKSGGTVMHVRACQRTQMAAANVPAAAANNQVARATRKRKAPESDKTNAALQSVVATPDDDNADGATLPTNSGGKGTAQRPRSQRAIPEVLTQNNGTDEVSGVNEPDLANEDVAPPQNATNGLTCPVCSRHFERKIGGDLLLFYVKHVQACKRNLKRVADADDQATAGDETSAGSRKRKVPESLKLDQSTSGTRAKQAAPAVNSRQEALLTELKSVVKQRQRRCQSTVPEVLTEDDVAGDFHKPDLAKVHEPDVAQGDLANGFNCPVCNRHFDRKTSGALSHVKACQRKQATATANVPIVAGPTHVAVSSAKQSNAGIYNYCYGLEPENESFDERDQEDGAAPLNAAAGPSTSGAVSPPFAAAACDVATPMNVGAAARGKRLFPPPPKAAQKKTRGHRSKSVAV